jgi:hypothetical protein
MPNNPRYFQDRKPEVLSYGLFLAVAFLWGVRTCKMSRVVPIGQMCPQKNLPRSNAAARTTRPGSRWTMKEREAIIVPTATSGSRVRKKSAVRPSGYGYAANRSKMINAARVQARVIF